MAKSNQIIDLTEDHALREGVCCLKGTPPRNFTYPKSKMSIHFIALCCLVRCAYNDPKPWLPPPPLSKNPIETLIVEDVEDRARNIVGLTVIDSSESIGEHHELGRKNLSPTSTTFFKMEK